MNFKEFFINENVVISDIEKHLRDRGVDPDKIRVITDKDSNRAIFLLYNLSGKLVGYQQYNPNQPKNHFKGEAGKDVVKYYTYVSKQPGRRESEISVWGLENINLDTDREIWVTEGIFDAVKLVNAGLPAIAALTSTPSPQLKQWFAITGKKIIVILDGDDAGSKLNSIATIAYKTPKPYKDLGEMKQDDVNQFVKDIRSGKIEPFKR
jgi:hypothetical protein